MKLCILLVALIVAVAEMKSLDLDRKCRDESGVTQDILDAFIKGSEIVPTQELKCHFKCLMEGVGIMVYGRIKEQEVQANQRNFSSLLDKCRDQKGADSCETAYLITKCCRDHYNVHKG